MRGIGVWIGVVSLAAGMVAVRGASVREAGLRGSDPMTATTTATGGGGVGTRPEAIVDPKYGMTAFTLDVPSGWKYAGTVARPGGCHGAGASMKFTLETPDGATGIFQMPAVQWLYATDKKFAEGLQNNGCSVVNLETAAGFLVNIAAPAMRPQARFVGLLPLPAAGQESLHQQLQQMQQQNAQMAARYGVKPQRLVLDGARMRVEYERNGKTVEEMWTVVIDCTESQMQMGYRAAQSSMLRCASRGLTVMRAPKGQLDAFLARPEVVNLKNGIHTSPEWMSRVAADQKAEFDAQQAANKARFEAFMKNNQAQHDAMIKQGQEFQEQQRIGTQHAMQADRANQAAIDNAAHRTILDSLGRQDFTDPNTGKTIEADAYYSHQWLSSDGSTLIQTDDHGFDPNGVVYPVQQSWTELVPK